MYKMIEKICFETRDSFKLNNMMEKSEWETSQRSLMY